MGHATFFCLWHPHFPLLPDFLEKPVFSFLLSDEDTAHPVPMSKPYCGQKNIIIRKRKFFKRREESGDPKRDGRWKTLACQQGFLDRTPGENTPEKVLFS